MCCQDHDDLFPSAGFIQTSDISEADCIAISIAVDENLSFSFIDEILQKAIKRNLPMYCLNPDKVVYNGERKDIAAGFFAEEYQKMGGMVTYYGKPHTPTFISLFEKLSEIGHKDKSKFIMVGDSIETDISGAIKVGIDSFLVGTGVENDMKFDKIIPTFFSERFQW